MAQSQNNLTAVLQDIADAIRSKKGTSATICPRDYADEIASIPSGSNKLPSVIDGSVTTLTADDFGSITSIKGYTFYYCSSLTSVVMPNTITSIGDDAFYRCIILSKITLSNTLTSIGLQTFYYCSKLTSITLPDTLTSIGTYAFYGCSKLTSMTIYATIPPTLGTSAISSATTAIYVPAASVNTYKSATNWSAYASRIKAITTLQS